MPVPGMISARFEAQWIQAIPSAPKSERRLAYRVRPPQGWAHESRTKPRLPVHHPPPSPRHRFTRVLRRLACGLVLLALAAAVSAQPARAPAGAGNHEPVPVRVQLQWRHQWQFAGFYAALEQGYYAEAGLDVTLLEGGPAVDPLAAVLTGEAEFGTAGADLLLSSQATGANWKVLASWLRRSPLVVIAQPDITRLDALDGKRVMSLSGRLDRLALRAMFRRAGISVASAPVPTESAALEAFGRGEADAIVAYRSNEVFRLQRAGIAFNVIDPNNYGIVVPDMNLFATAATVHADPTIAAALAAATNRGWAYALEYPEELIALIRTRWNTQDKSVEHLRYEAHHIHGAILPEVHPIGAIEPAVFTSVLQMLADEGPAGGAVELDELLFEPPASQLDLTPAEAAFVARQPRLRVLFSPLPPFADWVDGRPSGYTVALLERAAQRTGLTLSWQAASPQRVHQHLRAGTADLTINVASTPRRSFLAFSERSLAIPGVIVARRDRAPIDGLDGLRHLRVADNPGYASHDLLEQCCAGSPRLPVDSMTEALRAVASGRADAAVLPRPVALHLLETERLTELDIVATIAPERMASLKGHFYAVRRDLPELVTVLDKAYAALEPEVLQALWARWFGNADAVSALRAPVTLGLSASELDWLARQDTLRAVFSERAPLANTAYGRAGGYTVDLLRAAAHSLELDLSISSLPPAAALRAIETGAADVLLNPVAEDLARGTLRTSQQSVAVELAIFQARDGPKLQAPADLAGRRLAVGEHGLAASARPNIELPSVLVPASDDRAALQQVAAGDADAALLPLRRGLALIDEDGLDGVVFSAAGERLALPPISVRLFGVGHNNPLLASVLDKVIAATPRQMPPAPQAPDAERRDIVPAVAPIALTAAERAFLDSHPDITFGSDSDWLPLSYRDPDGNAVGIDRDTLDAVNALLGTRIRLELGDWAVQVERALRHEIDGLSASLPQPERSGRLIVTEPYTTQTGAVLVRFGNPLSIRGPPDLRGRRVGYIAGNTGQQRYLEAIEGALPVPFLKPAEGINKLLSGELEALMGLAGTGDYLTLEGEPRITEVGYTLPQPLALAFSVRHDWPLLVSALNKALAALTPAHREAIAERHPLPTDVLAGAQVLLTYNERSYLVGKDRQLRYCFNPAWKPYDYQEDGEHRGLFRDYLDRLAKKLGVALVPVPSASWEQALALMQERRCDLLSGMVRPERDARYLDFTQPYARLTYVVIAPRGTPWRASALQGRPGLRVGVLKDSPIARQLPIRYPSVRFVELPSALALRHAIDTGAVEAGVTTLEQAAVLVNAGAGRHDIVGQLPESYPIAIATRSDEPLLQLIMDKALAALTPAERDAIELKRTAFSLQEALDLTLLWQVLAVVGVVGLFLLYRQRELTRLNRALVAARDEAHTAAVVKSQFLANMSHEIRTPMNAVMGMARLCLDTPLDQRQRGWLERLHSASESLLGLVNDVLDLTRIEAGGIELRRAPFVLDEVLEKVQAVAEVQAREAGLLLWFDVDPSVPVHVIGDALRLEQVLLNLTSNAVKFTPRGEICVQVRQRDGWPGADGSHTRLLLAVTDTGIGVAPEAQARMFEPFRQVDAAATRPYPGSGLGLSISRELVQLMGGEIAVTSTPGRGSRFAFSVELGLVAAAAPKWQLSPTDAAAVLLWDGHARRGAATARLLRSFGLKVATVDSAEAALSRLGGDGAWSLVLASPNPETPYVRCRPLYQEATRRGIPLVCFAPEGEAPALSLPASRARLHACVSQALGGAEAAQPAFDAGAGDLPAGAAALRGRRMLLAEDNESNREYVRALLERAGCQVASVVNGRAAVRRALNEPFDVILMDIQMPLLDGYAAAQEIRAALGDATPPILAFTAHAYPQDRQRSRSAGMAAHLVKPVTPEALHAALRRVLGDGVGDVPAGSPADDAGPAAVAHDTGAGPIPGVGAPSGTDAASGPVVDFAAGLERAGGDAALYQRVLVSFHREHRTDPATLRSALAADDAAHVRRIAHTLKGAGGLIGAVALEQRALALMAVPDSGADWRPAAAALLAALVQVLAALETVVRIGRLGKSPSLCVDY